MTCFNCLLNEYNRFQARQLLFNPDLNTLSYGTLRI